MHHWTGFSFGLEKSLITCSGPSHNLNQWWLGINHTRRTDFDENSESNQFSVTKLNLKLSSVILLPFVQGRWLNHRIRWGVATGQVLPLVRRCHWSGVATGQALPLVRRCHRSGVATGQVLPLVRCCHWLGLSVMGMAIHFTQINSLIPGGFDYSLKLVNLKFISTMNIWSIFCEISIRWMPQYLTDH